MAKGKYERWLEPDGLLRLEGWARDGLTDEQIAHNIGIAPKTLYEWKKRYGEICKALKKGKEVVDIQVENALLKRALGYEYQEEIYERIKDTGQAKRHRHNGVQQLTAQQWEMCKAFFEDRCCYCGVGGNLTKDHLQPLSAGGLMSVSNIVPACQSCNSSKKDHQWRSWYERQKFYMANRANRITEYIAFASRLQEAGPDVQDGELTLTKRVHKSVVPDVAAQIFWLKNRRPDKWRDKPDPVPTDTGETLSVLYAALESEEDMDTNAD